MTKPGGAFATTIVYERRPAATPTAALNNPAAVDYVVAVRRTRQFLRDQRGARRFVVTAVTELRRPPGLRERARKSEWHEAGWVRHIDGPAPEPEWLRRDRIRALRRACHVDPVKGAAEPKWCDPPLDNDTTVTIMEPEAGGLREAV